jgi:ribosomal protein S18 acetylase RimI-like enzyme
MREITSRDVRSTIKDLLSYATTIERVDKELDQYIHSSKPKLYGFFLDEAIVGLVGVESITADHFEIKHIAVLPNQRGQSVGSKMIRFVYEKHGLSLLSAETDRDAVEFYRKYGFEIVSLGEKYPGVERFRCEYKLV